MAEAKAGQIDNVMKEERLFPPPKEFAAKARISSFEQYEKLWKEAADDIEGFWGKMAGELHWFKPYERVLQWDMPFASWFVHGQTNVSYNCLDIHLGTPRQNKAAFIWEGEPGETRVLTYQMLHAEVCKFANVLKSLGIRKGDVVALYMPMIPELPIAMLACADRRGPLGGLRRVLRGSHRRPKQRRRGQADDHRRRRLAARQTHPAEAEHGPCPGEVAHGGEMRRRPPRGRST